MPSAKGRKIEAMPTMARTQQYHRLGIMSVGLMAMPQAVVRAAADNSWAP